MLSKTHCPPLAWAVAAAAAGLGAVRRQRLNRQELDQALQAPLFPAPASDWSAPPLPEPTDVMASVILPAYNCAPYLRPCLDSVFAQQVDFKVQIIAVDDGSTDETPRILSVYRRENYEFFTLTDDGSAARARNAGLLRATGKYILFVDADDVLLPGALQALVDAAEAHHADVVQGGWRYLDLQGQPGLTQAYPAMEYRDRRRLSALDLPGTPWAKLYRRSLFQQIRFPANYTCFEDAIIHFLVFPETTCQGLFEHFRVEKHENHQKSSKNHSKWQTNTYFAVLCVDRIPAQLVKELITQQTLIFGLERLFAVFRKK